MYEFEFLSFLLAKDGHKQESFSIREGLSIQGSYRVHLKFELNKEILMIPFQSTYKVLFNLKER